MFYISLYPLINDLYPVDQCALWLNRFMISLWCLNLNFDLEIQVHSGFIANLVPTFADMPAQYLTVCPVPQVFFRHKSISCFK